MNVVCLDLEGVLVPEIWIEFAKKTGIEELKLTTRDISDYDVLMKKRIAILKENGLKLKDIQNVIAGMRPLEGAAEFAAAVRNETQLIILSDTFTQFAAPLMKQLNFPTIFCNELITDENGTVTDYRLRIKDGKRRSVQALQSVNFSVLAAGDSYNDLSMIQTADAGAFFQYSGFHRIQRISHIYQEFSFRIEIKGSLWIYLTFFIWHFLAA